jgi:hypothetical protein
VDLLKFKSEQAVAGHISGGVPHRFLGAMKMIATMHALILNTLVLALSQLPAPASDPSPPDGATGVNLEPVLTWTPAAGAAAHRVNIGMTSPGAYRGSVTAASFSPGAFPAGVTCYWRIDEVNASGITPGPVWSFTTQPARFAGDYDGDGDIDLEDFGHFQLCLSGSTIPQSDPACLDARFDGDSDVDGDDFGVFQLCFNGANLPPAPGCPGMPSATGPILPRDPGAITGSGFIAEVTNVSLAQREARILEEITAGNLPEFLRTFVPVTVTATIGGTPHAAVYHVMPDYLCIGADADFVRMPMTPDTAQAIADRFECQLTTRRMTNDIYTAATVKLAPSPISPTSTDITAATTFYQHHLTIETQRQGYPLGPLVAGIKKDVVVTPQLATHPGRVAIYGWHQLNGQPIQPLYLGHVDWYVDYSHGIRLVSAYMTVDGAPRSTADVLRDPDLNVLLSDEGPVDNPRY